MIPTRLPINCYPKNKKTYTQSQAQVPLFYSVNSNVSEIIQDRNYAACFLGNVPFRRFNS